MSEPTTWAIARDEPASVRAQLTTVRGMVEAVSAYMLVLQQAQVHGNVSVRFDPSATEAAIHLQFTAAGPDALTRAEELAAALHLSDRSVADARMRFHWWSGRMSGHTVDLAFLEDVPLAIAVAQAITAESTGVPPIMELNPARPEETS